MTFANSWGQLRRRVQFLCFVVFCILPFFNVLRVSIPHQLVYFAGYELGISEFGIIYFILMFLLFVIFAISLIYGRLYCSYLCPQMIFSDASVTLQERLRRYLKKHFIDWPARNRAVVERVIFYTATLLGSVALAFVFIGYFVDPADLMHRLLQLDIRTAGGIAGAVTTLLIFLDLTLLRHRFCTSVCPYGYLQGMLIDSQTLLVAYNAKEGACIECKKCVRVCRMGIDIRDSAHQIECIHCGECIDACKDVLVRLKRPSLIQYVWGDIRPAASGPEPWYVRIGIRDAKRGIILAIVAIYAGALLFTLSSRRAVLVRVDADRTKLYSIAADGEILNRFRLRVSNRSGQDATVSLATEALPGARVLLSPAAVHLAPGVTKDVEFDVAASPAAIQAGVNHFRFVTDSKPENRRDAIPMTFLAPERRAQ